MYWLQAVLDAWLLISNVSPSQLNKFWSFVKKSLTLSASDNALDWVNGFHGTYKFGLAIVSPAVSFLNHQTILFRVFLNGLTVVSTTFSGNDSISSHVNGICVYFHIINTQKNMVNNVVTKNHHSVKKQNKDDKKWAFYHS